MGNGLATVGSRTNRRIRHWATARLGGFGQFLKILRCPEAHLTWSVRQQAGKRAAIRFIIHQAQLISLIFLELVKPLGSDGSTKYTAWAAELCLKSSSSLVPIISREESPVVAGEEDVCCTSHRKVHYQSIRSESQHHEVSMI